MLRGPLTWAGFIASGLVLAACGSRHNPPAFSSSAQEPAGSDQGNYKIGRPYQIDGIWYFPREDWSYDETGIASWYGEDFHGRNTADGEVFDLNGLTAAHRTLPMPVVVRTTNLENGRSIRLRVNDRGPYAAGRIIDVSRRAAQLLGFEAQGTAKVRVQIDVPESMKVATAAGRNGATPSAPATVAAAAAPPPAGPVGVPEADRAAREPFPPPRSTDVRVAAMPPVTTPAPRDREVEVTAMPPVTAPVPRDRDVEVAAMPPVTPPARPASASPRPDIAPAPRRLMAQDRPYIFDELPGEAGAVSPQRVRVASAAPAVEITPVHPTQIYVQAGAFADQTNAARLSIRLRALGSPINVAAGVAGSGAPIYRVRLGPVADIDAADQLLSRVMADGFTGARIVVN